MRHRRRFKRRLALIPSVAFAVCLSLTACESSDEAAYGRTGYVQGFYGGISVDEPTAALIGRDVLTAGGSAADAAVAMTFAMAVTYPAAVSLGGGGVCLAHDSSLGISEVIDFVPPASSRREGDRPSAIPTLTRGMAALHARYGRFPWQTLVSPAERLARLGHRVSRAFATEIALAAAPLLNEPTVRAVFAPNGNLVGEGDRIVQADLATVLGRIRANGAGAFYTGQLGRRIVAGVQSAGGTLTFEELSAYTPEWRAPIILPYGDDEILFTPPPAAAGPMLSAMWRLLAADDRYASADEAQRAHLLAEVMKRAMADRKTWLAQGFSTSVPLEQVTNPDRIAPLMGDFNPTRPTPGTSLDPQGRQLVEVISGTGFIAVDHTGMAIACNLTLYNPFGTGRIAGETGILLAAAPGLRGRNPLGLGPVMAVNSNTFTFKFAVAAGGGPLAPAAAIQIAAETLIVGMPVDQAVAAPRFLAVDVPDTVLVEQEGGDALAAALQSRGHLVTRFSWQGRAVAVHCPEGLREGRVDKAVCRVIHDPRGYGLSTFTDESG